jgi:hypothetical protein
MSILDEGKTPEQLKMDRNDQLEKDWHEATAIMWAHFHLHGGSRINVTIPKRSHAFQVFTV